MTQAPAGGAGGRGHGKKGSGDGLGPGRPRRHPGPQHGKGGFGRSGWRYLFSMVAMTGCLAAVLARLLFVQGLGSARYQQAARSEYVHEISFFGERGAILDRNGDELAMSVPMTTIYADPYQVDNPRAEGGALASTLGLPEQELQTALTEPSGFVYLAHMVPDATAAKVQDLISKGTLPGIYTMQEPKRFYPAGQLAAPLLGFVGTDGEGLSGLEYKYNGLLEGKPGKLIEDMDPAGGQIPGGLQEYQAPVRGDDLVLSIDEPLQYDAEEALARAIVAAQAQSGVAVIMSSRTGDLLAVAQLTVPSPSQPATMHASPALPEWFVPPSAGPATTSAELEAAQPVEAPNASAFTNVYELGSVEKVVTISAALASGSITPTEVFSVPGTYEVAGSHFRDAWWHPTLDWTASSILAHSSDIGSMEIAQKMGMPILSAYIHAFGLGELTDVDFPGESAGLVPGPSQWSGTTIATVPIGQGIAVPVIQMLDAYNTIAIGGMYIAPRLVDGYIDAQGEEHVFPSPKPRRVVSSLVASEMKQMLEGVVTVGTGETASLEPYTVAGKTGTGEVPLPGGGYSDTDFVSSFAGFVPAEDPAITAMVTVVGTHQYGAEASAPVFAMIARDALQELGIPPHKPEPPLPGVPLATAYGGEGEAAGPALPGLTGTPDVVAASGAPSPAITAATSTTVGAAAVTTLPATTTTAAPPATTTTAPPATTTTAPPATTTTAAMPATTTTLVATTIATATSTTEPITFPSSTSTSLTTTDVSPSSVAATTTTAPAATTTTTTMAPAATTTTTTTAPAATTTAAPAPSQ